MTVLESLNNSRNNKLNEKETLINLQNDCGLKLSEAVEVCKYEFKNNKKFKEAAFDLRVSSLPSSGYMRKDGVTVVTDDWED